MAAKFFTGLPLDGPDPECVKGFGELALSKVEPGSAPRTTIDHSHKGGVRGGPVLVPLSLRRPDKRCDESPVSREVLA